MYYESLLGAKVYFICLRTNYKDVCKTKATDILKVTVAKYSLSP